MTGTIVSVILGVIVIYLAVQVFSFKSALREIKSELELTRKSGYNRQLTVTLFDKDLTDATAEINRNLDFQKQLKFETERKERLLKQSVSDIAHDLRTPLTVIKGDLQLVDRDTLSEQDRHYISVCAEKADLMKQMADDFFELALLESDTSPAELSAVNATNALMQLLADNEGIIRQSKLEPQVIFPQKSVFILADEVLLMRIMGNLLNNVIRYASRDFTVKLEENGCISFSNAVKGPLPDADSVFDRSYRSDRSRSGKGTGLGLYIVKLLAEKQGACASARLDGNVLTVSVHFKI